MSRDNRRRQPLFTALFADPYRKLAAIGLAFGLWMVLDNKVSKTETVRLRIQPVEETFATGNTDTYEHVLLVALPLNKVTPSDIVDPATNEAITHVELTLRGPKAKVESSTKGFLQLRVGAFLKADMDRVFSVEFDRDDLFGVNFPMELVTAMSPERVRLKIERNTSTTLSVQIDKVDIEKAAGAPADLLDKVILESAVFKPDSVTVSGPANLVDALRNNPKPFRVTLGMPHGDQINVPVRLANSDRALRVNDAPAGSTASQVSMMTMDVNLEMKAEVFHVPVIVDQKALPPNHQNYVLNYRDGGDTIPVLVQYNATVEGIFLGLYLDADDKRQWARDNLRVVVELQRKGPNEEYPAEWNNVIGRLQRAGQLLLNNKAVVLSKDNPITVNLKRQP